MPKFFVKTNQINNNEIKIVGEDVKHITQVLRAKNNEELTICDINTGTNYITCISKCSTDYVICNILKVLKSSNEPQVQITIFQGLPKSDKMEYIIQKNTELGASFFVPVIMQRCIAKLNEKDVDKKIQRWQKIATSAAKQSERNIIPNVQNPITLQELSRKINEFDLVILAYENEENNTLKNELKSLKNTKNAKIGMIIGPEGGLEKSEVETLIKSGAKVVTLGKRILRTETASIMITSNIIYEYEV